MSVGIDLATRGTVADTSPSAGSRLKAFSRSALIWVIVFVLICLSTTVLFLSQMEEQESRHAHFNNTDKYGTAAIVGVLKRQGVNVSTTESRDDALSAAADPNTSLVILNPTEVEPATSRRIGKAVRESGSSLTLVEPADTASVFAPTVQDNSYLDQELGLPVPVEPQCDWAGAVNAGQVTVDSLTLYSLRANGSGSACYPNPDKPEWSALVVAESGAGQVIVANSGMWYVNSELLSEGNAALAVSTTATRENVVFYFADYEEFVDPTQDPEAGNLPAWARIAFAWSTIVLLAVFLWLGRRMGPLAVETLPVVVPAIETVRGQAGLLHRTGDRSSALHALRTAALLRIARTLAIPAGADVSTICAAIANRANTDPQEVEEVFISAIPASDRDLSRLANRIAELESEITPL